jgi:hypothetical protein
MNSIRPLILLGLLSIVGSCQAGGDDALVKDVAMTRSVKGIQSYEYKGIRVGGPIFEQLTVGHFKQILAVARRNLEPGETIRSVTLNVEQEGLGDPLALVSTELHRSRGPNGRNIYIVWHGGQWTFVRANDYFYDSA